MDGMFLGAFQLFKDLLSDSTDPPPTDTPTEAPTTVLLTTVPTTSIFTTTLEPIAVTNSTNATVLIVDTEMHHTTATALVITALLVLIVAGLIALCFLLRKYCRCAYDLHYSLNYGKVQGHMLVPTEDQMEAGEMSKRSTMNVDSGIGNSRQASELRLNQSRPQTPHQQRPPRPNPPSQRSSLSRPTAEQRPLMTDEAKPLAQQPSGLYPVGDPASPQDTKLE